MYKGTNVIFPYKDGTELLLSIHENKMVLLELKISLLIMTDHAMSKVFKYGVLSGP